MYPGAQPCATRAAGSARHGQADPDIGLVARGIDPELDTQEAQCRAEGKVLLERRQLLHAGTPDHVAYRERGRSEICDRDAWNRDDVVVLEEEDLVAAEGKEVDEWKGAASADVAPSLPRCGVARRRRRDMSVEHVALSLEGRVLQCAVHDALQEALTVRSGERAFPQHPHRQADAL